MNANELMLGDWVKYGSRNAKVCELGKYIGVLVDGGYDIDNQDKFSSIPLTQEILERNGWSEDSHYFPEDEDYNLEIFAYEDGRVFWTFNLCEYNLLPIEHVHQLQHAIRLCGIDKEIML